MCHHITIQKHIYFYKGIYGHVFTAIFGIFAKIEINLVKIEISINGTDKSKILTSERKIMTKLPDASVRLDVWLWRARFFKKRNLATAYLTTQGVRLTRLNDTRHVTKSSTQVRVGDVVVLRKGRQQFIVEVKSLGVRRGPPTEAQSLFETID